MTTRAPRGERRADALSKQRIVAAAIEILDADGEAALTFRVLSARLATGAGALYHHVANKDELLAAASNTVIAGVLADLDGATDPRATIRAVALGVFDAIDAHPWVGAQLYRSPDRSAMLSVFESVGRPLQALGVAEAAQFDAASALVNYVLGVAGQNAANARRHRATTDRSVFLGQVAGRWAQLDPARYPFVRRVATQLAEHDDREQFLAGVELILAGIAAGGAIT